ncbi:MAG: TetR/AcrR family transcriptional regulator C-terminal domain-containing protein [Pseudomonadota bacterium]
MPRSREIPQETDPWRTRESPAADAADPVEALRALGPALLEVVTSKRAVALNRAAAGDFYDTGQLGRALAKGGRNAVVPLNAKLLERARGDGVVAAESCEEAADVYISLLLGDVQIRRAIGALGELPPEEITAHAERALFLFLKIYAAE